MKSLLMLFTFIISVFYIHAQIQKAQTLTIKVKGNCNICKDHIGKGGTIANETETQWHKKTCMATLTYDAKRTNSNAILKATSLDGYDNEQYFTTNEINNKFSDYCKHDHDKKAMINAIEITEDNHGMANMVMIAKPIQLEAVWNNYFLLKDAFVQSNSKDAAIKAVALAVALNTIQAKYMQQKERDVWIQIEKDLKINTKQIGELDDIDSQRIHFNNLSMDLYLLAKVVILKSRIYYQYCPMANSGKGANWLSKESNIKNPYYGIKMLTCGKTIETIQ